MLYGTLYAAKQVAHRAAARRPEVTFLVIRVNDAFSPPTYAVAPESELVTAYAWAGPWRLVYNTADGEGTG